MKRRVIPPRFRLEKEIVRQAKVEIKRDPDKFGSGSGVWYMDNLAVRSPWPFRNTGLTPFYYLREAYMSEDLRENGVRVPRIYGLHVPFLRRNPFFMIMERLEQVVIPDEEDDPTPEDLIRRGDLGRQFVEQRSKAEALGYQVGTDTHYAQNLLADTSGNLYLNDLESWESPPRIDRIMSAARAGRLVK